MRVYTGLVASHGCLAQSYIQCAQGDMIFFLSIKSSAGDDWPWRWDRDRRHRVLALSWFDHVLCDLWRNVVVPSLVLFPFLPGFLLIFVWRVKDFKPTSMRWQSHVCSWITSVCLGGISLMINLFDAYHLEYDRDLIILSVCTNGLRTHAL